MHVAKALSLALLAVLAQEGAAQAQAIQPPGGGKIFQPSPASVIVPSSSVLQAKDLGVAAHTNTKFIKPDVFASQLAISPLTGPPFAGQGFETPGSLACLYGLVTPTAGCNPNTALSVSTKGSKAIAIVDAYH